MLHATPFRLGGNPIGTKFYNNKVIKTFPEFERFTKVGDLGINMANAFESTNLEILNLPEGINTIKHRVFFGSTYGILRLPSTVTNISCYAPTKVTTLICLALTPPSVSVFANNSVYTKVYVPDNSIDLYKSASNWSKLASKMYALSEYAGS